MSTDDAHNPRVKKRKSLQRQMRGGREEGKGGLPLRGQQFLLLFKKMLLFKVLLFMMRLCECVNGGMRTDNHSYRGLYLTLVNPS